MRPALRGPRPRARLVHGSGFARSDTVIAWDGHHASLLDLCLANDLPVAWMCRGGVCGSCATTLLSDAVQTLAEPLADTAPGEVLLCISKPVTGVDLDL
ncbi:MAG: 2Fe-2S iron-sulfur cluster binding domain-containing protein [Streptosporangiales bacterium]|nr:2Fe-2S iron-sulfur cluster binding domain-containing protein [Streptosporangiales bacterium]